MADKPVPPVLVPDGDIPEQLRFLTADTGGLIEAGPDNLKIKVYHTGAFPWESIFKLLLYQGYQVRITSHKADLFVEAQKGQ